MPPIQACSGCSTARRCGDRPEGPDRKSCADCHGDAGTSMSGVAARYPAYDAARFRPIDLEQRINACRTQYQLRRRCRMKAVTCWR